MIAIVAAQDGMAQLTQQLATGDVGLSEIQRQAEVITGLGLSTIDASVLVASLILALKIVDSMRSGGMFITANDWLRRVLGLHPVNPPPPPRP